MPPGRRRRQNRSGLTLVQLRVLQVLGMAYGPLHRHEIARRSRQTTNVVLRAIGYSDPEKRLAFESDKGSKVSLLTLGLVEEVETEVDGKRERGIQLSELGHTSWPTIQVEVQHLPMPLE